MRVGDFICPKFLPDWDKRSLLFSVILHTAKKRTMSFLISFRFLDPVVIVKSKKMQYQHREMFVHQQTNDTNKVQFSVEHLMKNLSHFQVKNISSPIWCFIATELIRVPVQYTMKISKVLSSISCKEIIPKERKKVWYKNKHEHTGSVTAEAGTRQLVFDLWLFDLFNFGIIRSEQEKKRRGKKLTLYLFFCFTFQDSVEKYITEVRDFLISLVYHRVQLFIL